MMTESLGSLNMYKMICLNPLYWYITAFRKTVLWGQLMPMTMVLVCGGCAVVALVLGVWVFKRTQDKFILHI
jgi:ABC-2 type transport system permease protein